MENKSNNKIACYRLMVNDADDGTEVNFVSLVEDPAIQMDWVAFSSTGEMKKEQNFKFKIDNAQKQMLSGVFMIPDKPIYRVDKETGEEYFVVFTADDIERAVKKFFKNGYNNNINVEHSTLAPGCYVMDSWFIRDSDSNPVKKFGFNDLPVGTWVGTVHVEDENMWNEFVKTGKIKAFSVEGLFKFGDKKLINTFEMETEKLNFTEDEKNLIEKLAQYLSEEL